MPAGTFTSSAVWGKDFWAMTQRDRPGFLLSVPCCAMALRQTLGSTTCLLRAKRCPVLCSKLRHARLVVHVIPNKPIVLKASVSSLSSFDGLPLDPEGGDGACKEADDAWALENYA